MQEETEQSRQRPWPGWSGLRVACGQLLGGDDSSPVGISAVYYPAIGLVLGAAMAGLDRVLTEATTNLTASLGVVGFHVLATRGRPLRGLAVTACRMVSASLASTKLAVGVAELAVFALTVLLVADIDAGRTVALLFAPMLARSSMVVMATGSRQARDDGRQMKFSRELTFREFGLASTATFVVVFTTTNFLGLLLVLLSGLLTIFLRLFLHWRLGGVDRASLHAAGETVQLALLGLMALL